MYMVIENEEFYDNSNNFEQVITSFESKNKIMG